MEHVLVDKSVLFLDPDIINRIRGKKGLPFIAHSDLLEPYRSAPARSLNQESIVVRWFKRLLKRFL
ncbi:hypothetical protein [Pseudomonas sp. ZS1P83]